MKTSKVVTLNVSQSILRKSGGTVAGTAGEEGGGGDLPPEEPGLLSPVLPAVAEFLTVDFFEFWALMKG
jgi:hypothetical protein